MRAASLFVAALTSACSAPPPEPARSVQIEVIGDGPNLEPRRSSTGDSWMLALETLNGDSTDTLAHNR